MSTDAHVVLRKRKRNMFEFLNIGSIFSQIFIIVTVVILILLLLFNLTNSVTKPQKKYGAIIHTLLYLLWVWK